MDIQNVIAAQQKHQKSLIQRANVVSVGCGYKFKDGKRTDEICIVVGVAEKLPTISLSAADNMDKELVGLLYAGSDNSTIFNPIQDVFEQLGVTLPVGETSSTA